MIRDENDATHQKILLEDVLRHSTVSVFLPVRRGSPGTQASDGLSCQRNNQTKLAEHWSLSQLRPQGSSRTLCMQNRVLCSLQGVPSKEGCVGERGVICRFFNKFYTRHVKYCTQTRIRRIPRSKDSPLAPAPWFWMERASSLYRTRRSVWNTSSGSPTVAAAVAPASSGSPAAVAASAAGSSRALTPALPPRSQGECPA